MYERYQVNAKMTRTPVAKKSERIRIPVTVVRRGIRTNGVGGI